MPVILRERQVKAIHDTRRAVANGSHAPIIVAATGFGKTVTAAGLIAGAMSKGSNVLFLAHRQELIYSARTKLADFGIQSGIIMAGERIALVYPVQVASVQTLVRRMDKLNWRPDLCVIDECHLSNAASYKKIIAFYENPILIGLTGTPWRLGAQGLGIGHGGMFDALVETGSVADLIADGTLCPFRYFAPPLITTEGIGHTAGEFDEKELEDRLNTPTITGSFIAHWKRLAQGRPTMVFCVSVKHAHDLTAQACAAGIRAVVVDGTSEDEHRRNVLPDLAAGRIDMAVNCGIYIEGVDCPAISCVVDLAATESLSRFLQKIGRGMRIHPGKKDLIIIDHVGNAGVSIDGDFVAKHGMPDDPREWTLEGRKKRSKKTEDSEKPIDLIQCPECSATMKPRPVCDAVDVDGNICGHVFMTKPRKAPDQVDGELIEVSAKQAQQDAEQERLDILRRSQEVGMAKTYEELLAIAKDRNYKPGWAGIKWAIKKKQAAAIAARREAKSRATA